jgi:hypothetical protein
VASAIFLTQKIINQLSALETTDQYNYKFSMMSITKASDVFSNITGFENI